MSVDCVTVEMNANPAKRIREDNNDREPWQCADRRPWSKGSTGGSNHGRVLAILPSGAASMRDNINVGTGICSFSDNNPEKDMATDILRAEARHLFERYFALMAREGHQTFDAADEIQRQFDELEKYLNGVKGLLDDKHPVYWRKHTSDCNRASQVKYKLSQQIGKNVPLVTQAFLKFFEIVSVHHEKLVPHPDLKSFHLCEAPGAFITALEQFILQKHGSSEKWQWHASSLNPYFEGNTTENTFVDDRLIYNTLDHWVFGKSGTGNIFSLEIDENFAMQYDLVTADGSIDCQNFPADQEMKVLSLFYVETRCALRLLREGGSFVIKMFTFFHYETRQLLQILCRSFEQVTVRKPSCSRSGNSETYVVCVGYKPDVGLEIAAELDGIVDNEGRICGSLKEKLSDQFQKAIYEVSESLTQWQSDLIKENIEYFDHMSRRQREKLAVCKTMVADLYISRLGVKRLDPKVESSRRLSCTYITKPSLSKGRAWNVVAFEERDKQDWWKDHPEELLNRVQELHPHVFRIPDQNETIYEHKRCKDNPNNEEYGWDVFRKIKITTGKFYSLVTVSKFIEQSLLDLFYMMFPPNEITPVKHHPPEQIKTDEERDEIMISFNANFSSNEDRILFLDDIEKKLEVFNKSSASTTIIFEVIFSETVSRFAAGLLFLLASICDEIEFAATRIDKICFTCSFDSPHDVEPLLKAIYDVRQELKKCPKEMTVVEIFPLQTICSSEFFHFLRRCNERYYATNLAAVELLRRVEQRNQLPTST